jgi:B-cell receptor-associated protein 31
MASLVWMSVFLILAIELVITLILVVPVPRKIRNLIAKKIFKFDLGDRLKTPIMFIGIALGLALMESYFTHQRIMTRIIEEQEAGVTAPSHHSHDYFYPGLHDRERKYKSERNLYLAGFALTLLFVIGRLAVLLQESVELHEEIDRVEAMTTGKPTAATTSQEEPTETETSTPQPAKSKQEKKTD